MNKRPYALMGIRPSGCVYPIGPNHAYVWGAMGSESNTQTSDAMYHPHPPAFSMFLLMLAHAINEVTCSISTNILLSRNNLFNIKKWKKK